MLMLVGLLDRLGNKTKFHLVNQVPVCAPFPSSGQAIRGLRCFNELLLGKFLWKFGLERDALWQRVIEVKYSCEQGWQWGGVGSKDGSSPSPHMVLSYPIPAPPLPILTCMMGKIFLPHPCPLGPREALPHPIKLNFLLIAFSKN